jgi:hypothetical protein
MQGVARMNLVVFIDSREELLTSRRWTTFDDLRRRIDLPATLALAKGGAPFFETGFAVIDLLSASNQGYDDGPVLMSLHDFEQHLGF